jgi:hypothetical protein
MLTASPPPDTGTSADLGDVFRFDPDAPVTPAVLRNVRVVEARHKLAIGWPAAVVARYYGLTARHVFRLAKAGDDLAVDYPDRVRTSRPPRHA